jgi:hypothetical protein
MENKQTAVELLVEQVFGKNTNYYLQWKLEIDQALAMEKEQIIDAYNTSFLLRDKPYSTADKYYNETFKSE